MQIQTYCPLYIIPAVGESNFDSSSENKFQKKLLMQRTNGASSEKKWCKCRKHLQNIESRSSVSIIMTSSITYVSIMPTSIMHGLGIIRKGNDAIMNDNQHKMVSIQGFWYNTN